MVPRTLSLTGTKVSEADGGANFSEAAYSNTSIIALNATSGASLNPVPGFRATVDSSALNRRALGDAV